MSNNISNLTFNGFTRCTGYAPGIVRWGPSAEKPSGPTGERRAVPTGREANGGSPVALRYKRSLLLPRGCSDHSFIQFPRPTTCQRLRLLTVRCIDAGTVPRLFPPVLAHRRHPCPPHTHSIVQPCILCDEPAKTAFAVPGWQHYSTKAAYVLPADGNNQGFSLQNTLLTQVA
jgi:hypothetical protein